MNIWRFFPEVYWRFVYRIDQRFGTEYGKKTRQPCKIPPKGRKAGTKFIEEIYAGDIIKLTTYR